jgi:alpha-ketoglutarate-dependent 2,4-dichlorophenoxyacetate dioxygenase
VANEGEGDMLVRPLHPIFAAELVGADLTRPPTAELVRTVEEAMALYGVLVVRDCVISDADHLRFSRAFGPLELPSRMVTDKVPAKPPRIAPELFFAGNLDADGNIIGYASETRKLAKGAERFHTDSSFHAMPTKWSALLGHETPPPEAGGDTLFIDARAVYDDLPKATKDRIEQLVGIHDFWAGRRNAGLKGEISEEQRRQMPFPPVEHPLVRTMPYGRKTLFIGGHAARIKDMPDEEGRALIEQLYDFATREKYVYRHHWRRYDMTIWDNRCTMHAATPLLSDDYRRDMRRTTINEHGPETTAVQAMAAAA